MIEFDDLNPKGYELTSEQEGNAKDLLSAVNAFLEGYTGKVYVTSGIRDMADHMRIYAAKGITDESKIPMGSRHLFGLAVDLADPNRELAYYILNHLELLQTCGLWVEHLNWTKGWIHLQSVSPKSKRRFFIPSNNPPEDSFWDGVYDAKYDK